MESKQEELASIKESATNAQEREVSAQAEVERIAQALQTCMTEAESCAEAQRAEERSAEVGQIDTIQRGKALRNVGNARGLDRENRDTSGSLCAEGHASIRTSIAMWQASAMRVDFCSSEMRKWYKDLMCSAKTWSAKCKSDHAAFYRKKLVLQTCSYRKEVASCKRRVI